MGRSPGLLAGVLLLAALSLAASRSREARAPVPAPPPEVALRTEAPVAPPPLGALGPGARPPAWNGSTALRTPDAPVPLPEVEHSSSGWRGYLGEADAHVQRAISRSRMHATWRPPSAPPGPGPPGGVEGDDSSDPAAPGPTDGAGPAVSMSPMQLRLGPLTPNPSTGTVSVALDLPAPALVRVHVIDLAGRLVHESLDRMSAGRHTLVWSSRTMGGQVQPPGVYFVRVAVDGRTLATRRWVITP